MIKVSLMLTILLTLFVSNTQGFDEAIVEKRNGNISFEECCEKVKLAKLPKRYRDDLKDMSKTDICQKAYNITDVWRRVGNKFFVKECPNTNR